MNPGTCTYRLVPGDPQQTLGYPIKHFYFPPPHVSLTQVLVSADI